MLGVASREIEEGSGVIPVCLYMSCTAAAKNTAQSDCSTLLPILWGYLNSQAEQSDAYMLFLFNKLLGFFLPCTLTNQMLDLRESGNYATITIYIYIVFNFKTLALYQ